MGPIRMIAEFGIFFLILTLLFSSLGFLSPLLSWANKKFVYISQEQISVLNFFFTLLSFLCLTYSFISSDFSLLVVSSNSNTELPFIYKITGVWGNHEGSILLWLLVMTFFGFLFSLQRTKEKNIKKNSLCIQNTLIFLICLFVIFTSNPFDRIFPPEIEGSDLNPLLQDPGLIIHPPLLYLGYVGFSIVYSISLAVLIFNFKSETFVKVLKPWVFASWTFLTLGIGLGSWWAYYELGWGGFWFWDPVENASLLPWLTASALLHTIIISGKKKLLLKWTLLLSVITFTLSLLGTFLVRSGVLISVHAFANDPSRGVFILLLLLAVCSVGLFFYVKRGTYFKQRKSINVISKEGAISLNNVFMLTLSFTILLGTIYPLISSVFFNTKISVGAPFFNSILAPITIPLVLGMIFGPFLKWGTDDVFNLLSRLKVLLISFLVISMIIWYLNYQGPIISILFFILSSWLITSSLFELSKFFVFRPSFQIKKIPLKNISQLIAHIGIGLLIIGATGTSILKKEKIQFQDLNQKISISNFDVKFEGIKNVEGPNYLSQVGVFSIYKDKNYIKTLYPERRFYNSREQVTTEAAIHSTFTGDLYIAIGEKNTESNTFSWTTRIWFNPFTLWIWIGVLFLGIGGLISLTKSLRESK
ncbi:MAG: heme lyase CcmF/NrfE family subunit [Alphaproteobacteria bacterium]